MTYGRFKSRSLRRVFKKVPGGQTVLTYLSRKAQNAHCSKCADVLKGVSRDPRKVPKTQRRPDRPFGGVLCSKCSREEIVSRARNL